MGASSLILQIVSDRGSEQVDRLTRDLINSLNEDGLQANQFHMASSEGQKGDPITLGTIALSLITSGAAQALIECLKGYITRDKSLTFTLKQANNTVLTVDAKNVSDAETERAIAAAIDAQR